MHHRVIRMVLKKKERESVCQLSDNTPRKRGDFVFCFFGKYRNGLICFPPSSKETNGSHV